MPKQNKMTVELMKQESAHGLSRESVIAHAIEVIGDREAAYRWLGTPVQALDYATPISLLGATEGMERVEAALTQLEHGVW
jgi:putative toxin-antitoxin system antitoxin component (TIGR02293 family)